MPGSRLSRCCGSASRRSRTTVRSSPVSSPSCLRESCTATRAPERSVVLDLEGSPISRFSWPRCSRSSGRSFGVIAWCWILALGSAVWVIVEIAFALHGWPAVPRYLFARAGVMVVLAGVAVGWLLQGIAEIRRVPSWAGLPGHLPGFERHQTYPIVLFTPLRHGWSVLPWHTAPGKRAACAGLKASFVTNARHPRGELVRSTRRSPRLDVERRVQTRAGLGHGRPPISCR